VLPANHGVTGIPGCRSYHSHARRIHDRPHSLSLKYISNTVQQKEGDTSVKAGGKPETEYIVTFRKAKIIVAKI